MTPALQPIKNPPRPPRLRPTWTTWMWLGLAVAVVVAMVIGFWQTARPAWLY